MARAQAAGPPVPRRERDAAFCYEAPAELYLARTNPKRRGSLSYRRFETAEEAIRYAVRELPGPLLNGTIMVVSEERFDHRAISRLHAALGGAQP